MDSSGVPLKGEELREGYANIDFGSTATRTCIVVTRTDPTTGIRSVANVLHIQELRAKHDPETRFERGEYPSVGCPFDGPPHHVGFDAASQSAKRAISLKSIPYFLTLDNDDHPFTAALYKYRDSLPSDAAQAEFKNTLENMLLVFFTSVVDRIIERSETKTDGFILRKIALCVPNTWSARENDIQKYLSPILDKTVAGRDIETLFMFEAQAQSQFMIHRYPEVLRPYEYLMVLDFGGHSMGGSDGELKWGSGDRPRFFSPPESDFGTRGGYELWEILIGDGLDKARKHRKVKQRFPEEDWHIVRAALLKQFFLKKTTDYKSDRCLKVELDEILDPSSIRGESTHKFRLPGDEVRKAWDLAFRDVLETAKKNINRMAQRNKNILILLSGGSIENVRAREEIEGYCSKLRLRSTGASIDCTHISDKIDVVSSKWLIAEGGARCLAATMDVEEFFDRGGALALRMSTKVGNWISNHGKLLFCKEDGAERTNAVEIEITEDKECRIIADPLYSRPQEGGLKLFTKDCYDICDMSLEYEATAGAKSLTRIPNGKYILEVAEMVYARTDAEIILRLRPKATRARKTQGYRHYQRSVNTRPALDKGQSLLLQVPLASEGSNNLVELDRDLIQGRFWRFEENLKLEASAAEEKDEADVEDGGCDAPPAKRSKAGAVSAGEELAELVAEFVDHWGKRPRVR